MNNTEDDEIFIRSSGNSDQRAPLNQNLQPDIQKIDSIIRKIMEKKAPYSELVRLEIACNRLKSTIGLQIKQGG